MANRSILDLYAQFCIGVSLREAAEHGAIFAVSKLVKEQPLRGQGIYMPASVSPILGHAQALVRQGYRESLGDSLPKNWNFEDRGISSVWRQQDVTQKKERISVVLKDYLVERNLSANVLELLEIDIYERLFFCFHEGVSVDEKPELLLGLEIHLQDVFGERLEVFLSEMKDLNKIRRL